MGTTSNVNQQLNLATQGPMTAPIVDLGTTGTPQAPPFLATGTDTTTVPTFDPSSPTLEAPMSTQEMLVADAAVGSIIENSVDANGNVILSAQTINQLKSVSDQAGISFPQIESIIRSKGYTIDTTTPTLTNVDIASENISNILDAAPTDVTTN